MTTVKKNRNARQVKINMASPIAGKILFFFLFFFFLFFFFRVYLVSPMFSDLRSNGRHFEKLNVELVDFRYILKQIPTGLLKYTV